MVLNGGVIFVKDLARMAAFYGDVLGLKPIESAQSWVQFEAGGSTLGLHAIPKPVADQIEISSPPVARERNPVKLVFAVESLEVERERLGQLGVTLLERPWGNIDAVDPEGNVFQLCSSARP